MKIGNLLRCSNIKYKLSVICFILTLCLHVAYFAEITSRYFDSFAEKNNKVTYQFIQLHSRYEFENVFTTKFIYTAYIVINNILSVMFFFYGLKSAILFDDKNWKIVVNLVSILLPLTIFTGFINMYFRFNNIDLITQCCIQ